MEELWARFRTLPTWIQVLAWIVLWPVLAGLFLWASGRGGVLGKAAAVAVAVLLGPIWLSSLTAAFVGQEDQDGAGQAVTAEPTASPAATDSPSRVSSASPSPSPSPPPAPSPSPVPSPSPSPTAADTATVVRVIDGDTLEVTVGGTQERVRLAQVDAPESTTQTECYGPQATARLQELLPVGAEVVLRRPGPPFRDDYDRLLAEVLVDGTSVNEILIHEGYAEWGEEFADEDRQLAVRLEAAEQEARTAGRGLWSACVAPPPSPSPSPTEEQAEPVPFGGSSCHPAYDPCVPPPSEVGDLDCSDIRREYPNGVEVDHSHGDPHRLDGDKDGRGCE